MSDYRDDTTELAVASDTTWLGLTGNVIEELATISAVAMVTIGTLTLDSALVGDEVLSHTTRAATTETAAASDQALGQLSAVQLVSETVRISESLRHSTLAMVTETAAASDELASGARDTVTETAAASDQEFGTLRASVLVQDSLQVSETLIYHGFTLVDESAAAGDMVWGALRSRGIVSETAAAADEVFGDVATGTVLTETALASDEALGHLNAVQLVTETAQVEDVVGQGTGASQVWTANSEVAWAVSRYRLTATGLAVIDGVPHLTTKDGVFALDGADEEIEGQLVTGRLDVGGGSLATPVSMYLEYELDGALAVDVSQHQSGINAESYTYDLPYEPGDTLTNGRVVFGKGLRGRHFGFTVTITGRRAYINDMSLLVAPIKRRV